MMSPPDRSLRRLVRFGLVWLFTIAGGVLFAADLEVDNLRGSDDQLLIEARTSRAPFRTIQRAIDVAIVGDTIRIQNTGEPYRESISIGARQAVGAPGFPLVIEGNGATLDGTKDLGVLDWEPLGRDLFELKPSSPGYVILVAAEDQPHPEYEGHHSDLASLEPFQYARSQGRVYFRTRRGETPQAYGLRYGAKQTGLTLYEVEHLVIRNLNVSGYRLDGINCHSNVRDVQLENVTAVNNGRSGVSVGGGSKVSMQGGELRQNGESQARAEGYGTLELRKVKLNAGKSLSLDERGGRIVARP